MTRPTMDDPFDRTLQRFLGWQAEQLDGTPTANEMKARLAARLGATGLPASEALSAGGPVGTRSAAGQTIRLAWALAVVALIAALAVAVAVVGGQFRRSSVVLQTSTPTASPSTSLSPAAGPCPLSAEMIGAGNVTISTTEAQIPANALVAYLSAEDTQVHVAGGGLPDARVMATIGYSADISRVVGWSDDGTVVLFHWRMFSGPGGPERNCSDLFLVRADGSGATRLTASSQGEFAEYGALAPSGRTVAYVDEAGSTFELRVVDPKRVTKVLDRAACNGGKDAVVPFGDGRLQWSPDETYLALACLSRLSIYDVARGTLQDFKMPALSGGAIALAWTLDRHVRVATEASASVGGLHPLEVIEIDPLGATVTQIAQTDVAAEWVAGEDTGSAFSPDRRWLIAPGGPPGVPNGPAWHEIRHLIDLTTGATRQLADAGLLGPIEWLPDSNGFVVQAPSESPPNPLVEYDLQGRQTGTLGYLYHWGAWHWLAP